MRLVALVLALAGNSTPSFGSLALGLAAGSLAACAPTGAVVRKPDARLALRCNVPEARVYVDDAFVGRAGELSGRTLPVVSGARRVELRADGFFTAYRDVDVAKGAQAALDVQLHKIPDGEPPE
jgi:hypothetical protein